ncbi:MAG: prephenate dehydrogenase [Spirochaetota bacterium]|nr:prephenate dehydrogenase [Spirochaetota bacterium]
MKSIKKIAIIGVGLLGGSVGLALKKKFPHIHIVGIGRNEDKLIKALKLKAIDSYNLTPIKGIDGCDIIVIATPISTIVEIFFSILSHLKPNAVVTDVGSTKEVIINEIYNDPNGRKHFIGSHPMAGSEQSGIDASYAELYQDSSIVVIDDKMANQKALKITEEFWKALGGKVINMSAEKHDKVVAYTSHLPHIVASCLAYTISNYFSDDKIKAKIFGNGLLDTTRIAEGDPKMWLDILIANQKNILKSISEMKNGLNIIEKMIQDKNQQEINKYLLKSKKFRKEILYEKNN